ncbi:proline racemase family protein, partial [Rhodococcus sp. NPDC057529]|uniref:proline racemase family protein n=1 Tax=Rhodococcus sp. NPDC057529 TaxID=3346158 RepID=UPI0036734797
MPTRVVTGGVGTIPGATMFDRRRYFIENLDHIRRLLMNEPRGHSAMSGAILQPPTRPDADYGVLYIEVSGCLPMCGHGTMGVATVLVETGMVEVTEPVTTIRLDTPAGLVVAEVAVEDGAAKRVTLTNVPSFALGLDRTVQVGQWGSVPYDIAFGGNFYAIVELDKLGIEFDRANKDEIMAAGLAISAAINEQDLPVHPGNPEITGCHHVYLAAPGSTAQHSRHAMVIAPGMFDRSPCGTGTSARMAQLHARGELELNTDFLNESFIGTQFTGRLVDQGTIGDITTVTPTITGYVGLTGTAEYLLNPDAPSPFCFKLSPPLARPIPPHHRCGWVGTPPTRRRPASRRAVLRATRKQSPRRPGFTGELGRRGGRVPPSHPPPQTPNPSPPPGRAPT